MMKPPAESKTRSSPFSPASFSTTARICSTTSRVVRSFSCAAVPCGPQMLWTNRSCSAIAFCSASSFSCRLSDDRIGDISRTSSRSCLTDLSFSPASSRQTCTWRSNLACASCASLNSWKMRAESM
jgi:hypothetical protein